MALALATPSCAEAAPAPEPPAGCADSALTLCSGANPFPLLPTGFQTHELDLSRRFPKAFSSPGKVTSVMWFQSPHHPDHKLCCQDATNRGLSLLLFLCELAVN